MAQKKSELTIALPEGKNLGPQTLDLLFGGRITVNRQHPRKIEARVEGFPGISRAIFCPPEQVRYFVMTGRTQLGITGQDVIRENPDKRIEVLAELPYSRQTNGWARSMLFTFAENPVNNLADLKRIQKHIKEVSERSMVASDYPKETQAFLDAQGIGPCVHGDCWGGSPEVLVHERVCHYGVALVETGTTLAVNGLKEIKGGKIFDSCAVLIGNIDELGRNLDDSETERRRSITTLLGNLLKGTLEARGMVYLVMNAPTKYVEQICKILPALKSPTIQSLTDSDLCSIASVVPTADVNGLILKLMDYGATDFVTLPPSTVM